MIPAKYSTSARAQAERADENVGYVKANLVRPKSKPKSIRCRTVGRITFIDCRLSRSRSGEHRCFSFEPLRQKGFDESGCNIYLLLAFAE